MADPQPWDRQRDEDGELEPNLWYDRFTDFRLMGPGRSLLESVNRVRDSKGRKRTKNVPTSWRRACERWSWRQRSEAWDASERRKRIAAEEEARARMLERHIRLGVAMETVGGRKLQALAQDPEHLWFFDSPEEIEALLASFGVERLTNAGTDGIAIMLADTVDTFDDAEFEQWLKYHYATCEEPSILGYSNHGLYVCRKR